MSIALGGAGIQPGAVIGADGFGFATHEGVHHKIPHVGGVVVEDDVELGAGTTVDAGSLAPTRIGRGSKIDDQVMIAHGVRIGAGFPEWMRTLGGPDVAYGEPAAPERHVQKNSIDRPADENITRSARPIRFSNGTKPTPPAICGTRLSVELSRLSPMKK